jgi:hypothetical protein
MKKDEMSKGAGRRRGGCKPVSSNPRALWKAQESAGNWVEFIVLGLDI